MSQYYPLGGQCVSCCWLPQNGRNRSLPLTWKGNGPPLHRRSIRPLADHHFFYLFPVINLCYFLGPLHGMGLWQTIIFIVYYLYFFFMSFSCHFYLRQCRTADWKKNNYIILKRTVLHIYTNVFGRPPFLNYLFPVIFICINEE